MARVLIAGCGYVGSALAERLAAGGHAVWGLRREPAGLPAGVRPLAADLTDPAGLEALPPDLDVVFCTASPRGGGEAGYRAAYLEGPARLLRALERDSTPRRVILTSSTGVYGQRDGEWVDESSPAEPTRPSARLLLEGEAQWLAGPFPATVVRLAGIYGPGRTRLLRSVAEGTATLPRGGPRWTNRIHRDDCAGVLAHLMELPAPRELYLGVDCEPADRAEVLRWLAERLGVPAPPRASDAEGAAGDRGAGRRCRNDRLRASGYRFAWPTFREGYAPLVEAWRRGRR